MSDIIEKLDTAIKDMMIPEVQNGIKNINKLIVEKKATEDDYIALEDMESMYEDLIDIVLTIEEKELNEDDAEAIYQNILNLIEELKQD
ncbi:hypothetical protein [Poseidonibacter sp.]|uniref:hypothetical protein n=1 Tax=Poseidonibacter sp. TaxID=2321188 RepID=UPI00359E43D1